MTWPVLAFILKIGIPLYFKLGWVLKDKNPTTFYAFMERIDRVNANRIGLFWSIATTCLCVFARLSPSCMLYEQEAGL